VEPTDLRIDILCRYSKRGTPHCLRSWRQTRHSWKLWLPNWWKQKKVLRKEKGKDGKDQQSEEVESLKAQLLAAQKENERLKRGMFSMSLFETII